MYKQNYKVSWSEENQDYVGVCPKFPSLCSHDKTPLGALSGIRNLVDGVVKDPQDLEKKTS